MKKLATGGASLAALMAAAPAGARFARPRADANDPKTLIEAINKAVTEMRADLDQQVKAKADDVLVEEKIGRINAAIATQEKSLDEIARKIAAGQASGGAGLSPDAQEHRTAFNSWMRRGVEPEGGLNALAVKAAMTTTSDPDGGYMVPETMDATITRVLGTTSAMRANAQVISISSEKYGKLVNTGGTTAGWVSEKQARPETATPLLSEISPPFGELYANPAVTQRMLDDSAYDLEAWLAGEIATEFAEAEGEAFITGNGVNKPRGILGYDMVANGSYAWGSVGFVVSGKADGFLVPTTTASPADAVTDLFFALKAGYRDGASWLTNDATVGTIRKFKDGDGTWLWQPPTAEGPATILGKPIVTDDNMPAVAANQFPLVFANLARAYLILDRIGTSILRDPFTNKPYVHFYATRRVGGGIQNFEAVKALRIST
jgi:HK97 family phage major capsid protein